MYFPAHPAIPAHAIKWRFETARGAGGQHVNKVATAVSLRISVDALHLQPAARARLWELTPIKNATTRELIIRASSHRSQWQNRHAAWQECLRLVELASRQRKRRVATRPTRASKRRHQAAKRARSLTKSNRRRPVLE